MLDDQVFTFTYESKYTNQPETSILYKTNAVTLEDIFYEFEQFLQGAGFHIPEGQSIGLLDNE